MQVGQGISDICQMRDIQHLAIVCGLGGADISQLLVGESGTGMAVSALVVTWDWTPALESHPPENLLAARLSRRQLSIRQPVAIRTQGNRQPRRDKARQPLIVITLRTTEVHRCSRTACRCQVG